jgi:two-component system response regulator MprA
MKHSPAMTLGKTVLVVDDSEDTCQMLMRTMRAFGYRAVCAYNGWEAVQKVRSLSPDLILLDLNMPKMDGLTAAENIRQLKKGYGNVPIIAITAFDIYGMEEAATQSGCDEYLTKPLDLDRLENTLRSYLGYL